MFGMWSGAVVCTALNEAAIAAAAGQYGNARTGSKIAPESLSARSIELVFRSRLIDRLPLPVLHPAHIPAGFRGLRAGIRASHESSGIPRQMAHRIFAMAPVIRSRLRSRWPIFDILPSLSFPPVVCCRGTRPTQAAKSRPLWKVCIGGAKACSAIAVIGPTPGMVKRRDASSSWRVVAR